MVNFQVGFHNKYSDFQAEKSEFEQRIVNVLIETKSYKFYDDHVL